ncbi:hypothetical protein [Actinomyces howellii]|uniref:Uncharacterized protein n=1 Tax=Actinomyces howellii TaxID=52771 RepID=A0A448HGM5_9ACTO|nr:hypothetical protein [Actinomyces howellii]VEG28031.1 Uncharacterised protein [Actinomyces howellii]
MSCETRAALESALIDHLADEMPGMMPGAWVCIAEAAGIDTSDDEMFGGWLFESGGTLFAQLGMIEAWRAEKLAGLRGDREDGA